MSRILVVEDDADIASLIVHYLAPAGHESEVVANGSDALPAARRHPPDLIILDRMLPGLDGLESAAPCEPTRISAPCRS